MTDITKTGAGKGSPWLLLSGVPMLRQPDSITCGAASAAMAIAGSGRPLPGGSISALAAKGGVNRTTGTGEIEMARMLAMGNARWRRGVVTSSEGLKASIQMGQVVLLRLLMGTMPHWRVAVGFELTSRSETAFVTHCPSMGRVRMSEADLTSLWTSRDHDHFVVEVEPERSIGIPAYPHEPLDQCVASPIYRLSERAHGLDFYRHFGFKDNRFNSVSIVAFEGEVPVARITRDGYDCIPGFDRHLVKDLLMAVAVRDPVFMQGSAIHDGLTRSHDRQGASLSEQGFIL